MDLWCRTEKNHHRIHIALHHFLKQKPPIFPGNVPHGYGLLGKTEQAMPFRWEGREIRLGTALADPPDRMERIRFTCGD
ncbi:hypothetical protein ROHU_019250 [Labeo rohita]|uniref:Uncharacterized protein n=1 Tax=Labeo rohita TaxID=84645 RepID=A0A498N2R1_LABRO|nr:hypothetical protein ROHU_019250 [Labeo rohita]